jgi:DNA topoisomerase IA
MRRIHRAKFSAITKHAIQDAFLDLGEPDAALSRSVDARQELDLRVGVAMTRLLAWRCVHLAREHFSPSTKLISYGPCQTPTLSFCVDRARESEAFKSTPFWRVQATASFSNNRASTPYEVRWLPDKPVEARLKKAAKIRDQQSELDGLSFRITTSYDDGCDASNRLVFTDPESPSKF